MRFILKHGQPAVRIQTALAFCRGDCLERSLATSHTRRRSLRRATRHNLQAQLLNRFDLAKNRRKLAKGKADSSGKLKARAGQLAQYGHFLGTNIRRLRRLERRQSLLSAFLLRRIELYRRTLAKSRSGSGSTTSAAVLEPYTEELSEALFGGGGRGKRKPQTNKQQQQQRTPKKSATPSSSSFSADKGKKPPAKSKVDAQSGRKPTTQTTTKPRVPRKDEL